LSAIKVCLFAVLVLLLAACDSDLKTVRGVVTDVQSRSLTEIASFSIQDSDGRLWSFETEGPIDFTPSHIREHALMGQRVTVYYQAEGERLLAQRITD
jgi:predicted small secreted protein